MALPAPHPGPPADLHSRSLPMVETGQVWVRSHRTGYLPLYFGRSEQNRFDAPGAAFGVLYVAADAHGAFIETFGRQLGRLIVSISELADRELSEVTSTRPLRLVDMSGAGLARIGADARVMSGGYDISQPWSLALHNHPDQPDGLLYRSRHDASRLCAALFDRAAPVLSAESLGAFADPVNATLLGDVLDTYGFGLIA